MRKIDKWTLGLSALLAAVAVLLIVGSAAAMLTEGNVTAQDPENETIAVDADFSYSEDLTLNLTRDGTLIRSETITGQQGYTNTSEMPLTGLSSDSYNFTVESTNDANVTLLETRMETTRSTGINLSENDTVLVDVEFDAVEETNATVEIVDEAGTVVNSTDLTFSPIAAEDGSGLETVEYEAQSNHGNITVNVETSEIWGYEGVYVGRGDATTGGGGGAGEGSNGNPVEWFKSLSQLNQFFLGMAGLSLVSTVVLIRRTQ
jgi:hypothetical protein